MKSNHYFLLVSHTCSLSPSLTLAVATVGTSQLTDDISFQVPVSLLTSLKHGEFSQSGSGRRWYTMRQPLITGKWKLVDKFLGLLSIGGNSLGCSEGLSEIRHWLPKLETDSITHLYCLSSLPCLTLLDSSGFLVYWYPNPYLRLCSQGETKLRRSLMFFLKETEFGFSCALIYPDAR